MNLAPFLTPTFVEHPVGDKVCKFYPVSTRVLFQLRGLAKPIAKGIAALLTSSQNDFGRESVEVQGKDGDRQLRTTLQPIAEGLAKVRFEQRASTLDQLVDQLMSDASSTMIASMIVDSMREDFPSRTPTVADLTKFVAEVPAEKTLEMLMGVAKANRKLFDPLKERVTEMSVALKGAVQRLHSDLGGSPAETQETP